MPVLVRPAAAADIDEAFLWYERKRPGLGEEFLEARVHHVRMESRTNYEIEEKLIGPSGTTSIS